ncbi:MAG: PEP-CTERM sorting domain-containing protein [Gemmatimonadaceae bacterium]|nr:PEP-CTERM sorting domain-containing protein [Gemmatimonadaceae bacterium]
MKFTTLLSIGLLSLPTTLLAQGQVVGPNGTSVLGTSTAWIPDVQNGAYAQVTTSNPCGTLSAGPNVINGACGDGHGGVGSGSLELRLQGNNQVLGTTEWAFWYHWAGGSTERRFESSFGTIGQLSSLSFDWFRQKNDLSMYTELTSDWADKTPVMRLRLLEANGVESELVWEGWYNQCDLYYGTDAPTNCNSNSTPLDTWVRQDDMRDGRFWFIRPPAAGGGLTTIVDQGGCNFAEVNVWNAAAAGSTINELLGRTETRPLCLDPNAQILGLAVGIGSRWPHEYVGFVDNVRMGFTGQDGYAVNANFDFVPVPEPSSIALLGLGLAGLAATRRRRRMNG